MKKKIAFLCLKGLETFIKPIEQEIDKLENVESRLFLIENTGQMREAIDWADTVWIEWANELAVNASKYINIWDKDVYCRLHSYEALANYPAQIDWRVFKKLIFVAPHIQDIVFDQWPTIKRVVDTEIIYNGVDPVKPIGKPGYNIAVVGGISLK